LKQHLKIGFFKAVLEQEKNCLHFNVVLNSVKLKWKEALEFQSFFFKALSPTCIQIIILKQEKN
jgi:hypothetical protein